jgi:hypothetical protein
MISLKTFSKILTFAFMNKSYLKKTYNENFV